MALRKMNVLGQIIFISCIIEAYSNEHAHIVSIHSFFNLVLTFSFCFSMKIMKKSYFGWIQLVPITTDKKPMGILHYPFAMVRKVILTIIMKHWVKLFRVLSWNSVVLKLSSKVGILNSLKGYMNYTIPFHRLKEIR